MYRLLFLCMLGIACLFSYSQTTFAACGGGPTLFTCDTTDPNPDPVGIQQNTNNQNLVMTVLPGAGVDTTILPGDDDAIRLGSGMNQISVNGGSLVGEDAGIQTGVGVDTLTVNNSMIHGTTSDAIDLGGGNNVINITDSVVTSDVSDALRTASGNDTVKISGSELKLLTANGVDRAIFTGSGNDRIDVENSFLRGGNSAQTLPLAIDMSNGDDTLTIGSGVILKALVDDNQETNGAIQCRSGFDTIVFAMDVPEERLNFISGELAQADPAEGSITINGLFYEWFECEQLVNELNGVPNVRPIPTLSQWGLIAMAGIIGLAGFIAIRRRATA